MKKILSLFLSLLLCLSSLCGCALEEKPVTLADSMEIPEDGIIAAEIFETLKAENKVITFSGKSGKTIEKNYFLPSLNPFLIFVPNNYSILPTICRLHHQSYFLVVFLIFVLLFLFRTKL